jgi:hypothetical protein
LIGQKIEIASGSDFMELISDLDRSYYQQIIGAEAIIKCIGKNGSWTKKVETMTTRNSLKTYCKAEVKSDLLARGARLGQGKHLLIFK